MTSARETIALYDAWAATYGEAPRYRTIGSVLAFRLHESARRLAATLVEGSGDPVLEVGCGNGRVLARLGARRRVGVDLSLGMLHAARERLAAQGPASFVVGGAGGLPFQDGTFRTILCVNLLHNLTDPAEFRLMIREMGRVLAPGGRLVADIRNARNPVVRWYLRRTSTSSLASVAHQEGAVKGLLREVGCPVVRTVPGWIARPWAPTLTFVAEKPIAFARDASRVEGRQGHMPFRCATRLAGNPVEAGQ